MLSLLFILPLNCLFAELTSDQKESLIKGETIAIKSEVKGKVWPKMTIHMFFEGVTPLQAFAFYVAYKHQQNFVLDVKTSVPILQKTPTHVLVDYVHNMPWPVSDAKYTTGNIIEKVANDTYKISWYQVKSTSSESAKGYALFSPLKNGTLFNYYGHTEPKSVFGGLLKDIAPKNLQKTLEKIKKETIKAVKDQPQLVQSFIKLVTDSFSGKWVYVKPKKEMK